MVIAAAPVVIFDLDDTLYPEREFALSGFRAASRWAMDRLGTPDLAGEMAALLDAGHLGALFGMVLARHRPDHSKADLDQLVAAYRDHRPQIRLFDDAALALDRLAGHRLGLITDGTARMQHGKIDALGIRNRFEHVIATDELGGRAFFKPHPLAFERMEAQLGLAGRELVYVGDNPAKDFLSPNRRGWLTVQIRREVEGRIHDKAVAPEGGAAHRVIASLDELPAMIGG